jgi:hypothetical protein
VNSDCDTVPCVAVPVEILKTTKGADEIDDVADNDGELDSVGNELP